MNPQLSHTALQIGLCGGIDIDNHSKAQSVPLDVP